MTRIKWAALIVLACASVMVGGAAKARTTARSIAWVDRETGETVFTAADMVRFDWERQMFELKRERAMDLEAWLASHLLQHRSYVVRDAQGVIYEGRFISRLSSFGYTGPTTLIDDLSSRGDPVLRIHDGYPTGDDRDPVLRITGGHPTGDDSTRFSPRLLRGLRDAGVIGTISESNRPKPIEAVHFEWVGNAKRLMVRAKIFTETMRRGRTARMHLYFYCPEGYRPPGDSMAVLLTVSANQGRFRSTAQMEGPSPNHLSNGACVFRFNPWKPASTSRDAVAKAGPAQVRIEVVFRRKTGSTFATVRTVKLGPRKVAIL